MTQRPMPQRPMPPRPMPAKPVTQKLILPINQCRVTASYKTAAYSARFGFTHFGADMVSFAGQDTVYASGKGTVVVTGPDNLLGNVVIVRYDNVCNHKTGKIQNVIARYYHLRQILVSAGAAVTKDTKLAYYGNTGRYSAGAHLHIEFDSNTATPRASKTLGGNSNIILASQTDTTINPFELLHAKATEPDYQEIRVDQYRYGKNFYALPECARIPRI